MKRWLAPTTVAVAAVLSASAATAVAAPNPNKPGPPVPSSITWPCPQFDDPVTLDLSGRVKTIDLPGERQMIASPGLRVTVTAPNGHTASYLITGGTHVTYLPNKVNPEVLEVKSTGLNLLLVPEANGHPSGLALIKGNVNFAITPTGDEIRPFSGPGKVFDVCQALV
jgi:hypothetical protein